MEGLSEERPFNSIKVLFKVYFDMHASLLAFHFPEVRNHFLNNDGIIGGSSIGKKTGFALLNDPSQKRTNSSSNDLSDTLILGVTMDSKPKVLKV